MSKAQLCAFCGARSELLCDGRKPDGATCDKPICRAHAKLVAHVNRGRKGCDTFDLCPDCVAVNRTI